MTQDVLERARFRLHVAEGLLGPLLDRDEIVRGRALEAGERILTGKRYRGAQDAEGANAMRARLEEAAAADREVVEAAPAGAGLALRGRTGTTAKSAAAATKTPGTAIDFENIHPRGRGGKWISKGAGMPGPSGKGQPDPIVGQLQTRLRELGFQVPTDGQFGMLTEQAVIGFQTKYGLPPTGKVDASTVESLRNPPPKTATAAQYEIARQMRKGAKADTSALKSKKQQAKATGNLSVDTLALRHAAENGGAKEDDMDAIQEAGLFGFDEKKHPRGRAGKWISVMGFHSLPTLEHSKRDLANAKAAVASAGPGDTIVGYHETGDYHVVRGVPAHRVEGTLSASRAAGDKSVSVNKSKQLPTSGASAYSPDRVRDAVTTRENPPDRHTFGGGPSRGAMYDDVSNAYDDFVKASGRKGPGPSKHPDEAALRAAINRWPSLSDAEKKRAHAIARKRLGLHEASYSSGGFDTNTPTRQAFGGIAGAQIKVGGKLIGGQPEALSPSALADPDDRTPGMDAFMGQEPVQQPPNLRDAQDGTFPRCSTCVHHNAKRMCALYSAGTERDDLCDSWYTLTPPEQQAAAAAYAGFLGELNEAQKTTDGTAVAVAQRKAMGARELLEAAAETTGGGELDALVKKFTGNGMPLAAAKKAAAKALAKKRLAEAQRGELGQTLQTIGGEEDARLREVALDRTLDLAIAEADATFGADDFDGAYWLNEAEFSAEERKKLAAKGKAMPHGGFPIRNTDDLKNAIRAFGRAKFKKAAKAWIIKMARKLGATSLLPDGWNAQTQEALVEALADDSRPGYSKRARAVARRGGLAIEEAAGLLRIPGITVGAEWLDPYADELAEAADSMMKATVHEPLGKPGGPGLWKHKSWQLPAYVQRIARDVMEKRGVPESRAIAIAISAVKRWAAGGGKVDPGTRAAAAKALAEWSALKAKAKASSAGKAAGRAVRESAEEFPAELARLVEAVELYEASFPLAIHWDPRLHPRRRTGQFTDVLHTLMRAGKGAEITLPHGISVRTRKGGNLEVLHGGKRVERFASPGAAAHKALDLHDAQDAVAARREPHYGIEGTRFRVAAHAMDPGTGSGSGHLPSEIVLRHLEQFHGKRVRLTNQQGVSRTGQVTVHELRPGPGAKPEFRDSVVKDVRFNGSGFSHGSVAKIEVMRAGRYEDVTPSEKADVGTSERGRYRTTVRDYLDQVVNWGGVPTRRGDVIREMERQGHPRGVIDRYMQGLDAGARARGEQPKSAAALAIERHRAAHAAVRGEKADPGTALHYDKELDRQVGHSDALAGKPRASTQHGYRQGYDKGFMEKLRTDYPETAHEMFPRRDRSGNPLPAPGEKADPGSGSGRFAGASVRELRRRRQALLDSNRGKYGHQVTGGGALDSIEAELKRRGHDPFSGGRALGEKADPGTATVAMPPAHPSYGPEDARRARVRQDQLRQQYAGLGSLTDAEVERQHQAAVAAERAAFNAPSGSSARRGWVAAIDRRNMLANEQTRREVGKLTPGRDIADQLDKMTGETAHSPSAGAIVMGQQVRRNADGSFEVYEHDRTYSSKKNTKFTGSKSEVAGYIERELGRQVEWQQKSQRSGADVALMNKGKGTSPFKGMPTLSLGVVPHEFAVQHGYATEHDVPATVTGRFGKTGTGRSFKGLTWKPDTDPERAVVHYLGGVKPPANFPEGSKAAAQWTYKKKGKRADQLALIQKITEALAARGTDDYGELLLEACALRMEQPADLVLFESARPLSELASEITASRPALAADPNLRAMRRVEDVLMARLPTAQFLIQHSARIEPEHKAELRELLGDAVPAEEARRLLEAARESGDAQRGRLYEMILEAVG